jgi:hypothetical protein
MRQLNGFWANHTQGSIHVLTASAVRVFEPWPWSLITSLDSLRDLSDVFRRPAFKTVADEAVVVGTAVLVSSAGLIRIAKGGFLTGFDEVWLLSRPPGSAPPHDATIVGPADAANGDLTATIAWMRSEACGLALGDGIGLNYVTTSQSTAFELERLMSRGT